MDMAPIKTKHSDSLYRVFMSVRTDGGLKSLTRRSETPSARIQPRARSMSLLVRGWSMQRSLRDARATVRVRVTSRTYLEQVAPSLLSRHMVLKVAANHQLPVRSDTVTPAVECRPGLNLSLSAQPRLLGDVAPGRNSCSFGTPYPLPPQLGGGSFGGRDRTCFRFDDKSFRFVFRTRCMVVTYRLKRSAVAKRHEFFIST